MYTIARLAGSLPCTLLFLVESVTPSLFSLNTYPPPLPPRTRKPLCRALRKIPTHTPLLAARISTLRLFAEYLLPLPHSVLLEFESISSASAYPILPRIPTPRLLEANADGGWMDARRGWAGDGAGSMGRVYVGGETGQWGRRGGGYTPARTRAAPSAPVPEEYEHGRTFFPPSCPSSFSFPRRGGIWDLFSFSPSSAYTYVRR
ncbi:hypothetical protein R3P38DRAFT_3004450 [Favolaschia claudopus]|uniref:Uncharacterized protein n=1 Tax=Favolaschia claudopus TaxID=2862362 RepID=A0AAW0AN96_9AGAR